MLHSLIIWISILFLRISKNRANLTIGNATADRIRGGRNDLGTAPGKVT